MSNAPLITLKNGIKHYCVGSEHVVKALDGVDVEIERGEFVMIVGVSGSGKSTLMHILGCLDGVSNGELTIAGRDVHNLDDGAISALRNLRMGFVFQQFNLLSSLTVLENIALPLAYAGVPRQQRQEIAKGYARRVGLEDRLQHKPSELSGGQSQRVAIARALVNNPDILLADEPTGALDSKTGKEIMDLFHELNDEGVTVLMVTHDPVLASQGTRKLGMKDGKLYEDVEGARQFALQGEHKHAAERSEGLALMDTLRIGLKEGVLAHKMRSALTMLGIIIGVAAVIAMSSFSEGSKKKQLDQIRLLGANLIKVVDKHLEGDELAQARIKGSRGLTGDDAAAIAQQIEGFKSLALMREVKAHLSYAANPRLAQKFRVLGVSGPYLEVNNLSLNEGGYFSAADYSASRRVAVVGHKIAAGLGRDAIGAVFMVAGKPYRVIGVLAQRAVDLAGLEASAKEDDNYDILIPLNTALNRSVHQTLRNEVDEIQVQMRDEESLIEGGRRIRRILAARHRGVDDFDLVVPLDLIRAKQEGQKLLEILSISICAISLVVGGIGIMNIMLATVRERLREIGIRRAVGGTSRDIRRQFLSEAVLLSVVGALIGVIVALIVVVLVAPALALPVAYAPGIVALAILFAVLTGLVFGYYPAHQASQANVVEVLRGE